MENRACTFFLISLQVEWLDLIFVVLVLVVMEAENVGNRSGIGRRAPRGCVPADSE